MISTRANTLQYSREELQTSKSKLLCNWGSCFPLLFEGWVTIPSLEKRTPLSKWSMERRYLLLWANVVQNFNSICKNDAKLLLKHCHLFKSPSHSLCVSPLRHLMCFYIYVNVSFGTLPAEVPHQIFRKLPFVPSTEDNVALYCKYREQLIL